MQNQSSEYEEAMKMKFPEQEKLKCPRCDSPRTKFCYYNNYNLSQPRHFCKSCRRYWTKGGSLRNIPVGGGSRKTPKQSLNNPKPQTDPSQITRDPTLITATPPPSSSNHPQFRSDSKGMESGLVQDPTRIYGLSVEMRGSFRSLLESNGQLGSGFEPERVFGLGKNSESGRELDSGFGEGGGGSNGWPDHPIYNPGSGFSVED